MIQSLSLQSELKTLDLSADQTLVAVGGRGLLAICKIIGFGTFSVSHRAATTGRNPRTGEAIQIAASKNAKFKSGKGLKDAVNR